MDRKAVRQTRLRQGAGLFILLLAVLAAAPAAAGALERLFAPRADRWAFWDVRNDHSDQVIDHSQWDALLRHYVVKGQDGINRLAYAQFTAEDRQRLDDYIDTMAQRPIRQYSGMQQLAYWINLYNALTVQTVLQYYPLDSIRDIDISPGFLADGPWGKQLLSIEGQALSLNDIEHRILRPIWQDPRLHYALNCASLGCPNLQDRAFAAEDIDAMLDQAAAAYINHPRGVSIESGKLYVSSIYSWFQSDFGGSDTAVITHLQQFAEPALQAELAGIKRITADRYDWALNDAP